MNRRFDVAQVVTASFVALLVITAVHIPTIHAQVLLFVPIGLDESIIVVLRIIGGEN